MQWNNDRIWWHKHLMKESRIRKPWWQQNSRAPHDSWHTHSAGSASPCVRDHCDTSCRCQEPYPHQLAGILPWNRPLSTTWTLRRASSNPVVCRTLESSRRITFSDEETPLVNERASDPQSEAISLLMIRSSTWKESDENAVTGFYGLNSTTARTRSPLTRSDRLFWGVCKRETRAWRRFNGLPNNSIGQKQECSWTFPERSFWHCWIQYRHISVSMGSIGWLVLKQMKTSYRGREPHFGFSSNDNTGLPEEADSGRYCMSSMRVDSDRTTDVLRNSGRWIYNIKMLLRRRMDCERPPPDPLYISNRFSMHTSV